MQQSFIAYSARAHWHCPNEKKQPNGSGFYIFYHFHSPIRMELNNTTIMTAPHAMMICSPDIPQHFSSPGGFTHDFVVFHGDLSSILENYELAVNTVLYPKDPTKIQCYVKEIENEYYQIQHAFLEIEKVTLLSKLMLVELSRQIHLPKDVAPAITISEELLQKFQKLRAEVYNDVSEKWTIKKMAQRLFMNESLFHKYYKMLFAITPNKDFIHARIEQAKTLLFSGLSIKTVSEQLGYPNQQHFIRQFKQIMGVSPGRYVAENKKHYFKTSDVSNQRPLSEKKH